MDLPCMALFGCLVFETDREYGVKRGTADTVWLLFLVLQHKELDI